MKSIWLLFSSYRKLGGLTFNNYEIIWDLWNENENEVEFEESNKINMKSKENNNKEEYNN